MQRISLSLSLSTTESLAQCASGCHDGIVPARSTSAIPLAEPSPQPDRQPLDDVSKKIIEQLQEDGRRPYASIASSVGLSEAAVRQRVQRLVRTGVVQIVAVTNPLHLGFTRQAMIGIKIDGRLDPVVEAVSALEEVAYVVVTAGSFDVLVEVICEDDEHLLRIMNQSIRTIEGVRSTETFVYLELSKQTYTWGTR
jgi:Lrp/AsnC family transcriptional regulator for asnA, asnC and gidA